MLIGRVQSYLFSVGWLAFQPNYLFIISIGTKQLPNSKCSLLSFLFISY